MIAAPLAITAGTAHHRCRRPGCKGILRSSASIARGMSILCDRKVRQAEAKAAECSTFNAEQQAKADTAIHSGEVTIEGPGLYGVPSSKNDGTRYATDGASCCCPAGMKDRRCWHLLVAIVIDLAFPVRRPVAPVAAPADIWTELDDLTDAFMTAA